MRVIRGRNVNELWFTGVNDLSTLGRPQRSRNGDVIVMPHPVTSVYEQPTERVLFCENRDANPFFHLMEALWMLAGRDDAGFLNHYVQDFGTRFAEEHGYIHGAYGSRWRHALGYDQLDEVVEKLRRNPDDRQAVIQMWDGRDSDSGCDDLRGSFKDRPCNTHVYLRVRSLLISDREAYINPPWPTSHAASVLDLTVCCRSNDVVWGAYGSNAVHFSVLQEYLAGRIGVGVGTMYQLSNNFHGYVDVLDRLGDPMDLSDRDPYDDGEVYALPMGSLWSAWDDDLSMFMDWHDKDLWGGQPETPHVYKNGWFGAVAVPMACANHARVARRDLSAAIAAAKVIVAPDWRRACVEWLERRVK